MKSDINGTSQCADGSESFEAYKSMASGKIMYQYDYRAKNGLLFSTVAQDLDVCRKRRDNWLNGVEK
jgi:hypothetical protein